MIKIKLSQLSIVISIVIIGSIILSNKFWRDENRIIEHDIISYYGYLPSIFIYQDASLMFLNKEENKHLLKKIWYETSENGGRVIKTTMGVSYLYFPFFLLGHHYAINSEYLANGFSLPYRLAIACSSLFYFIISLLFIRKFLLGYFNELAVFWTILIIGIGTNLVNYVTREPGMSHIYTFFLISVLLYYSDKWYKETQRKHLYLIGFVLGLLILIRPTNILLLLIFLFFGVNSIKNLQERFKLLLTKYKQIIIAAIIGFVLIVPQLLYWKYNTGHWLFYSYPGEGFYFNDPKILEGLFGYRKGWLLYTPLMALSVIGLVIPHQKTNKFKPVWSLFFALFIYMTFSWWAWWYGGSFGMRALIDIYPILAIPIAVVVEKFSQRTFQLKVLFSIFVISLISLNLFQNHQYKVGIIHHDSMTKETYQLIWGETSRPKGYWESLNVPDYKAARRGDR